MTLPCVNIELTTAEMELLRPGSDLAAQGLANAKLGVFPHLRPWHRIDLVSTAVYGNRAYDQAMHDLVIALRAKLLAAPASGLLSLSSVEIATAALFLRLHRYAAPMNTSDPGAVLALGSKLEKFRKRAKRLAQKGLGLEQYRQTADTWSRFLEWTRYSVLQFKPPRFRGKALMATWTDQRRGLTQLIEQAIEERCFHPLDPDTLRRIVRLAKAELRRGRHSLTLMQVLGDSMEGKRFMFAFLEKRKPWALIPALGAELTPWKKAMLREAMAKSRKHTGAAPRVADANTDAEMERWIQASLKSWKVPLGAEAPERAEEPEVGTP